MNRISADDFHCGPPGGRKLCLAHVKAQAGSCEERAEPGNAEKHQHRLGRERPKTAQSGKEGGQVDGKGVDKR